MVVHTSSSSHDTGIGDTLAEVFIRGVVCEASKLILHSLGQCRIGDNGILSLFTCEISIKVSNIEDRFLMVVLISVAEIGFIRLTTLGLNGGWIFLASRL